MAIQTLHHQPVRLLSDRQVAHRLGITSLEFDTLSMEARDFPEPVELTPEISNWIEHEIDDYIDMRIWRRNQKQDRYEEARSAESLDQHAARKASRGLSEVRRDN
jgi:predicted DNA-binding transcriptional regulator AlpA